MRWFRQALQKSRLFLLGFLLVETFFLVDGQQFVYAYQVDQQKKEIALRSFADTFGIPVEKLRGDDPSLYHSVDSFFAEDVVPLVRSSVSELESSIRDLYRELERVLFPADVQAASTPPQEPEGGSSEASRKAFEERWKERRLPLIPTSDKELTHPELLLGQAKSLPVRRVEKRAARQEGRAADPRATGVAVSPSVPRQTISKAGMAQEIVALAESLGNSASRIFRFVHDSIDFDAKWGADKPPLGTLWEGAGTSWDQAWLLRDLLTAAGVDARFEWGEVEITPEMLTNVTGVDDPFRAGDLLTTAGVPIVLVVSGSQVVAARMSHVWIKAHVDYIPNRGVTPGAGDTWVRMDPSLNRFDVGGGVRLDEEVPFDLGEYLRSGTLLSPRAYYEEALQTYVDANNLGVSGLEELKPRKSLIAESFPFVPGTLRAKVLSVAGEATEVPGEFQQQLELQVREAGGAVLLAWSTPWPAVYGKRVELAWPGATLADQATLDLNGGVFATPPFEVDLRPVIRLEGAEAAQGQAIGSAEDVGFLATLTPPQGSTTVAQFDMFAGEHAILAVDFGRVPQQTIDRYSVERDTATDPAERQAWSLAMANGVYLKGLSENIDHLSALRWRRPVRLGNVALAVQRGGVSSAADGTPLTFSTAPPAIILGLMGVGLFPPDEVPASTASAVATLELLGAQGSVLEGESLTEVLGGEHVTTVSFLTAAVRDGQTLTRVDATNVEATLVAADLSSVAETTVRAGVARGLIAWISERQLPVATWDVTGYVLEDPSTGAGGYFVTYERVARGLEANIVLHSPQDLDELTAPIDVVATLEGEAIDSWVLSYRAAAEGPAVELASGTGTFSNTVLGRFDPTLLLNGLYDIVLTARDAAGKTASTRISVSVDGQMKIGNLDLKFVDLAISLSGLDLEVIRTYDSRNPLERDFGAGWTLDILQGSYSNNRRPGDGWQIVGGLLPCESAIETLSHLTTIRLSDHEIYRFRLHLTNPSPIFGGCFAQARFAFVSGPQPASTLEILDNTEVLYQNSGNQVVDTDTFEIFEPQRVQLRVADGRVFDIDLATGVNRIEDSNGNEITVTPSGLRHSSGRKIEFERDTEGRIARIVDPMGQSLEYNYDSAGNLTTFTNRDGNTVRYFYKSGVHRLTGIENPNGVRAIHNEFDHEGRLIRHVDAFGQTIEYMHDLESRTEIRTDRLGNTQVFEYDDRGNVIRETDETGAVTLRTFDNRDNLLTQTDPLGNVLRFEYDSNNHLTKAVDPFANEAIFSYNAAGKLLEATDALGNVTKRTYDSSGNVTSLEDALGNEISMSYDTSGNILSTVGPDGTAVQLGYDSFGNLLNQVDALGRDTTFTYDANGNRLTEVTTRSTPDGSETLLTTNTYDASGRLLSRINPDSSSTVNSYDAMGRVIKTVDPAGGVTLRTYDNMGRQTASTLPDGSVVSTVFDAEGRVLEMTDERGDKTAYAYDSAGRILTTTFPDGAVTDNSYDAGGRLISMTDARGGVTTFGYDAAGRRTSVLDAMGGLSKYSYDAIGNQTSFEDSSGNVTRFFYDAANRPIRTVFADGSTALSEYNEMGRLTASVDQAGRRTEFAYNPQGLLTSIKDALGNITSLSYDEMGNLVSQTDTNGHVTRFAYDVMGRPITRTLPDGRKESMAYDIAGNLIAHTDFVGKATSFVYDSMSRLIQRTTPEGESITFFYTPTGQRESIVDSRGTTSYIYDDRDRLVSLDYPDGKRIQYGYDSASNRIALTATVGAQTLTTNYTFDALNRLATVTDPRGEVYAHVYDPNGNREELVYPNGVSTSYQYDLLNRLTGIETTSAAGDIVQRFSYSLDAAGNRIRIEEADSVVRSYAYDAVDRLLSEEVYDSGGLVFKEEFAYDAAGNRSRLTRTDGSGQASFTSVYDETDRLLSSGTTSYTWDTNGRLVARNDSGETTLTWDSEDRLKSLTLEDGTFVENSYDADGNLIRRQVSSPSGGPPVVIEYLVDPMSSQVIATANGDGAVMDYYVRGDDLLSVIRLSGVRYYHADGLGSVRALTDANGDITDTYVFTAFGELVEHTGSDRNAFLFAGEARDPNSGFYYLRARWMDPSSGRFLSSDKFAGDVQSPLSLHKYLYAHANPVMNTDPSGNVVVALVIRMIAARLLIGAVLGAVVGGLDAALGGRDVIDGIITGAVFGGLFAGLSFIRIMQPILIGVGLGLGAMGAFQAILDDDWDLATFRIALLLGGAFVTWKFYLFNNVRMMNPAQLRWSQRTAGGRGRADILRASLKKNGWKGPPIDAVETPDGIVAVDHTRAAVALELGMKSIPVRVHKANAPLPREMIEIGRFGSARTWGEAVGFRAGNQRPPLSPSGTPTPPRLPPPKGDG